MSNNKAIAKKICSIPVSQAISVLSSIGGTVIDGSLVWEDYKFYLISGDDKLRFDKISSDVYVESMKEWFWGCKSIRHMVK